MGTELEPPHPAQNLYPADVGKHDVKDDGVNSTLGIAASPHARYRPPLS